MVSWSPPRPLYGPAWLQSRTTSMVLLVDKLWSCKACNASGHQGSHKIYTSVPAGSCGRSLNATATTPNTTDHLLRYNSLRYIRQARCQGKPSLMRHGGRPSTILPNLGTQIFIGLRGDWLRASINLHIALRQATRSSRPNQI